MSMRQRRNTAEDGSTRGGPRIRRGMRRENTEGAGTGLTTMAGWLAIALGAVHVVVVPLRRRRNLAQVWADGWWNAFTIEEPTTPAEAERALTFWQTLGSFGYPMLALGGHLVWSAHRGRRAPRSLGGVLLAWGLPFSIGMPSSPGWAIPVIGGLVIAGDTNERAPEPRTRTRRIAKRPSRLR